MTRVRANCNGKKCGEPNKKLTDLHRVRQAQTQQQFHRRSRNEQLRSGATWFLFGAKILHTPLEELKICTIKQKSFKRRSAPQKLRNQRSQLKKELFQARYGLPQGSATVYFRGLKHDGILFDPRCCLGNFQIIDIYVL